MSLLNERSLLPVGSMVQLTNPAGTFITSADGGSVLLIQAEANNGRIRFDGSAATVSAGLSLRIASAIPFYYYLYPGCPVSVFSEGGGIITYQWFELLVR